jgi:hypothetical protein
MAMGREHRMGNLAPDLQERSAGDDLSVILVKNTSGGALPRYAVVGLDEPIIDPAGGDEALATFQGHPGLCVVVPVDPDHVGRFAVLLEPVGDRGLGTAAVAGVVPVRLDVQDAGDGWAEVADGIIASLKTGPAGSAQILWKQAGTGPLWGMVRLGANGGRQAGALFPVDLAQVGGADGSDTAPATWTYDVADSITGVSLASAVDPTSAPHRHRRPSAGSMLVADVGIAYRTKAGALVLASINEVADQGPCVTG